MLSSVFASRIIQVAFWSAAILANLTACSRSDKAHRASTSASAAAVSTSLPMKPPPAPAPASSPDPSDAAAELVKSWNKAHNDHDIQALRLLYAPKVDFYGQHLESAQIIELKARAFERDADFRQQLSSLKIEPVGSDSVATFSKSWLAGGKARTIEASLQVGSVDGHLVIVKESDVTVPAGKPRTPVAIKCGSQICSKLCCASFEDTRSCGDAEGTECELATNGEGAIWRCDGPEDCAAGEVCCGLPDDRLQVIDCTKAQDCTGAYDHPRYHTTMPLRRVCHDDKDCPRGLTCGTTDEWTTRGLTVCR